MSSSLHSITNFSSEASFQISNNDALMLEPEKALYDSNEDQEQAKIINPSSSRQNKELSPAFSNHSSRESTSVTELSLPNSPLLKPDTPTQGTLRPDHNEIQFEPLDYEGRDSFPCPEIHKENSWQFLTKFPAQGEYTDNDDQLNSMCSNKNTTIPTESEPGITSSIDHVEDNHNSTKNELNQLTPEDDQILLKLVVQLKNSWKKIFKRFNLLRKKSVPLHALRARYAELVPKVSKTKGKFSHKEDCLLAKYYSELGSDWQKISTLMKNRTPNMLKNRYYSYIRKKKLLNELLNEHEEEERQQASAVNTSMEPDYVDTIKFFIDNDNAPNSYRIIDVNRINSVQFLMSSMNDEDELHVKITPPQTFSKNFTEPIKIELPDPQNYNMTPNLHPNNINERLINTHITKLKEEASRKIDPQNEMVENQLQCPQGYRLRERRATSIMELLNKRNEAWSSL